MSDVVNLIRAASLTDEAPYAYAAAVTPAATLIFTAGACPLDEDGCVTPPDDIAGQARVTMRNLEIALAASGATLSDVVKTTVYVASSTRSDLVDAWDVIHEQFGDHEGPSTLIGVAVLGYPGQLVEVEAIAAIR
jgi:enamine deaminase RidA (YjgF/YER057c/UK114 family)